MDTTNAIIVEVVVPVHSDTDRPTSLSILWSECFVRPSVSEATDQVFAQKAVNRLIAATMGNV